MSIMMRAYWGTPIFDPVIMPSKKIVEMATLGGAKVIQQENDLGTLEVGKKADLISINIDQPHIQPTHNMINTLVEIVNSNDVLDVIVRKTYYEKSRSFNT